MHQPRSGLVKTLLIGCTILVFSGVVFILSKVSFLFTPIQTFLSTIAGPFLIAGFLYYLLQPLVKLLRRIHIKGRAASILAFIILLALIGAAIAYVAPRAVVEVKEIVDHFPAYLAGIQTWVHGFSQTDIARSLKLNSILDNLKIDNQQALKVFTSHFSTGAASFTGLIGKVGKTVINILLTPIVLLYFLKDGHRLLPSITRLVPPKWRPFTKQVLQQANKTMENYFNGQFVDMLFVGVLSAIGYAAVGTPYALVIGIIAGVLNMVPYIGPWLGGIPAVLVATSVSWHQVIWVIIVAVVVQQIDNKLIYPNVIGKSMNVHPLTILVLLLTSGNMFGLVGVILAIPGYAVLKTILQCIADEPLIPLFNYLGHRPEVVPDPPHSEDPQDSPSE